MAVHRILDYIENIENVGSSTNSVIRNIRRVSSTPKIYVREEYNQDPFELYDDYEFRRRYRFTKTTVTSVILPLIETNLSYNNNRGLPISPRTQLLIALRFYASGSFQMVCGDHIKISQSTVSLIIAKVSREISKLLLKFVHFPNRADWSTVKSKFELLGRKNNVHGLYNIIGAIDCTHIKITRPRGIQHSEAYRNRKSFFSINVQIITGPNMEIYDIVTRWPGSSHDSRIFRNSEAFARFARSDIEGILVGDSGYPSLRFLLTPLLEPTTTAEHKYNRAQIKTRNLVERFFGIWKKKFACLQNGLRTKLRTTSNIIIACAVLHNIGIQYGDIFDEFTIEPIVTTNEDRSLIPSSVEGLAMRQTVISQF